MTHPQAPGAGSSLRDAVGAEQARLLYGSGFSMFATLVAAAGLAVLFVYLGVLKVWIAATWLLISAAHISVRLVMIGIFRGSPDRDQHWRAWVNRFTIGAAVGGITWGIGGAVIMPQGRFDLQMLVVVLITSIIYGTLSSFGAWYPAFMVFATASIVPLALWSLGQHDAVHYAFTFLCAIWLPAVLLLARRQEAGLVRSLNLQFENAALAQDLLAQKTIAEVANVAKSRFLASASHDLRQPVHALGMLVGALRSHKLPARSVSLIDQIDGSVGALDSLFTSLLDISKLDAGVVRGRAEAVSVHPLLERIRRDLEGEASAKGVVLTLAPTNLAVVSDPVLLERILRNLIGNAVRYTEQGHVLVGCRRRAGWGASGGVSLEVWDTGPGIAADQREAIFEEFYQLANPDRDRSKGLGLGLPIVRRLTEILDHPLELESRPGHGTVFRVLAPRAVAPQAAEATPAVGVADARSAVILAIDDEQAIRVAMTELLKSWGHQVVAAGGGDEAIAALAHMPSPDLIVCDYRLRGGENGLDVIRRLQTAIGTKVPAIVVTGDTAPENIRDALTGGHPLLHKPLSHARLRAAVSSLIRRPAEA